MNSTNSDLDLSRGALSKQLLKLMGQKLQDECNEYASLAVGKVAVTSAEKMFCKVILHVNLPSYNVKGSQRVSLRRFKTLCHKKRCHVLITTCLL